MDPRAETSRERYGAENRGFSAVAETSRQYIKIWRRKPTQCIKIGSACINIWSQEPKAESMY